MGVAVQHMVTGDGFLSVAFGCYIYLHLGIFNQVRDDQVMVFLWAAFYYGNVRTLGDGRVPVRLQCFLHPLVLGKHHQSRSCLLYTSRSSGNVIQFYINDGNWTGCQTSSLEWNRWYHVAATYQKCGGIALYLDGKKVGSSSCGTLQVTPNADLQAGTAPSYSDRYMRGYIQDLSLWKDVRLSLIHI